MRLAAACRDFGEKAYADQTWQKQRVYDVGDFEADKLPAVLRDMKPMSVSLRDDEVIVHMDGGGVGASEGFLVPTGNPQTALAKYANTGANVLCSDPLVFRYCWSE